jgi:hypothetical protein
MKAAPRARFGASAITAWGRLGGWPQALLNQYFMENQEHSKELCEQAAKEQDPEKLMQLTKEIIRLLDERTPASNIYTGRPILRNHKLSGNTLT